MMTYIAMDTHSRRGPHRSPVYDKHKTSTTKQKLKYTIIINGSKSVTKNNDTYMHIHITYTCSYTFIHITHTHTHTYNVAMHL